jgi:hypothetical protein
MISQFITATTLPMESRTTELTRPYVVLSSFASRMQTKIAKYSVRWCRYDVSSDHQERTQKDEVPYDKFVLIY